MGSGLPATCPPFSPSGAYTQTVYLGGTSGVVSYDFSFTTFSLGSSITIQAYYNESLIGTSNVYTSPSSGNHRFNVNYNPTVPGVNSIKYVFLNCHDFNQGSNFTTVTGTVYCPNLAPSPTPSVTPTSTPSVTPPGTPPVTPTPTSSPSVTPPGTPPVTATPTPTPSVTPPSTPDATPTSTPTPSVTPEPSAACEIAVNLNISNGGGGFVTVTSQNTFISYTITAADASGTGYVPGDSFYDVTDYGVYTSCSPLVETVSPTTFYGGCNSSVQIDVGCN
jgi:hypothetical protein